MMVIYLDYNCYQRGFDDLSQSRIMVEALACHEVFRIAEQGSINLVWSFMHQREAMDCPFMNRKEESLRLSQLSSVRVKPIPEVRERAIAIQSQVGFAGKDALHYACAIEASAVFFLTCDAPLLKRILKTIESRPGFSCPQGLNPVDFIITHR